MSDASKSRPKARSKPRERLVTFLDRITFSQTFLIWLCVIMLFAGIYFVLAWQFDNSFMYRSEAIEPNAAGLLNSVYFSFITATTLGYGDIAPTGVFSKLFAAIEVVTGLILWGLVISKLIGVKQERILEEVYDISYEEIIDRLRSGLYLFRSDANRVIEKVESEVIKPREVRDLWIIFSGLDATLANIKNLIMPAKSEKFYYKKMDVFRLELLLNSIQLSFSKMLDLIKTLKSHELEWKNDILLSSIHTDITIVKDIIEHESKRSNDKKVLDKVESLKKVIWEIECEEKEGEAKPEQEKPKGS